MASQSEQTFGKRLQNARDLHVGLGKIGGYAPDNNALGLVSFAAFLDTVQEANDTVASTSQVLSDARTDRRVAYFGNAKEGVPGLATLAGRVRDAVGSMPGGKKSPYYRQVQKLVQKVSRSKAPKKPVGPPPSDPNAQKKEISRSEASYGSLLQAGRDLAAAAGVIPGYNPASNDLKPAALVTAMQTLSNKNKAVTESLVDMSNAVAERAKLYDADGSGLRSQFQQAKAAAASQFGRRSVEYKSISGIKY